MSLSVLVKEYHLGILVKDEIVGDFSWLMLHLMWICMACRIL
jgi:hypothetical protein